MGCRVMVSADHESAVLYCSTTEWAFGPVFSERDGLTAQEVAELFLRYVDRPEVRTKRSREWPAMAHRAARTFDPRSYDDVALEQIYSFFMADFDAVRAAEERAWTRD